MTSQFKKIEKKYPLNNMADWEKMRAISARKIIKSLDNTSNIAAQLRKNQNYDKDKDFLESRGFKIPKSYKMCAAELRHRANHKITKCKKKVKKNVNRK